MSYIFLCHINDNSCLFAKSMDLLILNPLSTDACPVPNVKINLIIDDNDLNLSLTLRVPK